MFFIAFSSEKPAPDLDTGWREESASKERQNKGRSLGSDPIRTEKLGRIDRKIRVSAHGTFARRRALSVHIGETEAMLIERGLQVMNVEVVGDAYAIASNYLRRTGAISETIATNDQLLEIIMALFQRGEFNKIKLANKAIAQFEAAALV